MVWTRGPAADYDAWDTLNPGGGWGWHDLLPYFQKVRNSIADQDDNILTNKLLERDIYLDGER